LAYYWFISAIAAKNILKKKVIFLYIYIYINIYIIFLLIFWLFSREPPSPQHWESGENPPYAYYAYYIYSNLVILNECRKSFGLNIFPFISLLLFFIFFFFCVLFSFFFLCLLFSSFFVFYFLFFFFVFYFLHFFLSLCICLYKKNVGYLLYIFL